MTHEQCPFCKSKDRLSIRMPVHECWIQCRVCGARGPTAKNSDDAWTFWLWAWQEPEPASTTEEKADPDNWLANHPRILELTREIERIRELEDEVERIRKNLNTRTL